MVKWTKKQKNQGKENNKQEKIAHIFSSSQEYKMHLLSASQQAEKMEFLFIFKTEGALVVWVICMEYEKNIMEVDYVFTRQKYWFVINCFFFPLLLNEINIKL